MSSTSYNDLTYMQKKQRVESDGEDRDEDCDKGKGKGRDEVEGEGCSKEHGRDQDKQRDEEGHNDGRDKAKASSDEEDWLEFQRWKRHRAELEVNAAAMVDDVDAGPQAPPTPIPDLKASPCYLVDVITHLFYRLAI
jgi:hypothetical protein